MIFKPPND